MRRSENARLSYLILAAITACHAMIAVMSNNAPFAASMTALTVFWFGLVVIGGDTQ